MAIGVSAAYSLFTHMVYTKPHYIYHGIQSTILYNVTLYSIE